ncbi:uncharacterized protein [Typha angustifolia]|uniref:uncharacterized protein isoform X2 n=1 Tax=Typha angustifolia TaxID=59011 RepID=UPI003C2E668E
MDVIRRPEEEPLSIEGMSSPIAAHILDFCDDGSEGGLLPYNSSDAPVRSSDEVSSSTTTATNIAATTTPPFSWYDDDAFGSATFSPFPLLDSAALSILLDTEKPPDSNLDLLVPSIHYPFAAAPPCTDHQNNQITLSDTAAAVSYSSNGVDPIQMGGLNVMTPVAMGYEEGLEKAIPGGYMGLEAAFYSRAAVAGGGGGEGQGDYVNNFSSNGMAMAGMEEMGELQRMMESSGMMGMYNGQDSMQRVYSSGDVKGVGGTPHLMVSCSGNATSLPASEISSGLEDSTFKIGRLSVEERREKIHRYMKKRNERNFSKKIKYACRKTLADSRPRVRGRFAKNDDFGEATGPRSHHHAFDDEEEVMVKEEEDILDSSDILAHISGVNSFKYNYTLQSWYMS